MSAPFAYSLEQDLYEPEGYCPICAEHACGRTHEDETEQEEMTTDTTNAAPTTAIAEYNPTAAALAALRERMSKVVYDVKTTVGMDAARKDRRELVRLRTALEAKRVEIKAPALQRSRLIDSEARRITEEILALETPIDEQILVEERRKEAEKVAREKAEADRVAAIKAKIDEIKRRPVAALRLDSAGVIMVIGEIEAELGDDRDLWLVQFAEFRDEAIAAHEAALEYLTELRDTKVDSEAEEQRQAEAREQLRQQQQEQARADAEASEKRRVADEEAAQQRAEQDRLAREAREREETEARERREAQERADTVERNRVARIRERIDAIARVATAGHADSTAIEAAITRLVVDGPVSDVFEEFIGDAVGIHGAALSTLRERLAARRTLEQQEREEREAAEIAAREAREAEARDAAARTEEAQIAATEKRARDLASAKRPTLRQAVEQILFVVRNRDDYTDAEARAEIELLAEANLESPDKPKRERRRKSEPAGATV